MPLRRAIRSSSLQRSDAPPESLELSRECHAESQPQEDTGTGVLARSAGTLCSITQQESFIQHH